MSSTGKSHLACFLFFHPPSPVCKSDAPAPAEMVCHHFFFFFSRSVCRPLIPMPTSCFPWQHAGTTSDGKLHFCSLFLHSKLSAGPTSQCQPPPCNGDAPAPGAMVCQVLFFFL